MENILLSADQLFQFVRTITQAKQNQPCVSFGDYIENWFETFKKPNILPNTYKNIYGIYKRHIYPTFCALPLHQISATTIQTFLNRFLEENKNRTAEELRNIFNGVFTHAYNEGIISINPMKCVKIPKHYRESGSALTLNEIKEFLSKIEESPCKYAFLLILYSGIRRGELKTIQIEEDFLTVLTEKTHKGVPKKRRRIPICDSLRKHIPLMKNEKYIYNAQYLSCEFKKILPNHHLHDLRHTFTTRAIESGVNKAYVDYITGHKSKDMTLGVYTHFDDDFGRKEIKKLDF